MSISKDRSLMLTSTRLTRSTLDRILYGCWTVLLWAEGPGGVVALITCDEDSTDGGFGIEAQRDRICSLGGVGVTYKPSQTLVMQRIMAAKAYAVAV
jgi:hypothetical protein